MPKNNARFVAKRKALIKQKNTEKQKVNSLLAKIKRTIKNPKFWLSAGMIASALAAAVLLRKHLESLSRIATMTSQITSLTNQRNELETERNRFATERQNLIQQNNRLTEEIWRLDPSTNPNNFTPNNPRPNNPRPNQPRPQQPRGGSGFGEERFGGLDYDSMPRDLKKLLMKDANMPANERERYYLVLIKNQNVEKQETTSLLSKIKKALTNPKTYLTAASIVALIASFVLLRQHMIRSAALANAIYQARRQSGPSELLENTFNQSQQELRSGLRNAIRARELRRHSLRPIRHRAPDNPRRFENYTNF